MALHLFSHHKTKPVMFRAGRASSAPAVVRFPAPATYLSDISEFQPDINDARYLEWSKAIVIRAMYGDQHDDAAWYGGARRADLHAGGARFLGIYQYVVAGQSVTDQASALADLVGPLRAGEVIIGDFEEGGGDLRESWLMWSDVIEGELGFAPWDYSGLDFAADHGLQPVNWLADYTSTEPAVPHRLWQFTDRFSVPGVGTADCSVFHGTIDQLAALAYQGKPAPAPAPPPKTWQETLLASAPQVAKGATGTVVRTIQGLCIARGHSVSVDGVFGPSTEAAVQAVQRGAGLTADGVVGPKTWPALFG
jgi:Putative peptidoglycan binding domain/Glycosyl hydrolases family 25